MFQVIYLHVDAPPKPAEGQPCNGCGICCASEPCPLGILASVRSRDRCTALEWDEAEARYRCGLVSHPERHLPAALRPGAPIVSRLARRYISAGSGCDCSGVVSNGIEAEGLH